MSEAAPTDPAPSISDKGVDRSRWGYLARTAVVGLVAGLIAVLFQWSLYGAEMVREGSLSRLQAGAPVWGWAVLPVTGLLIGCLVGWMVRRFEPAAAGSGIPHVKGVLLHVRELRWKRVLPVKFLGTVMAVGTGLSLGREGPTVQLGAAVARGLGDLMRIRPREMPQMIACGAGAGVSAAFNAPLAGFIFVLEELRREMSPLTYAGALVASVCAAIMTRSLTGQLPSFHVEGSPALPLTALPAVVIVGVMGGLMGVLFNKMLLSTRRAASRITAVPAWAFPGVAGMLAGFAAWWLPDAVGGGHAVAERVLGGGFAATAFTGIALLVAVKLALTVISFGSGAPGGVFGPMLLLGSLMGILSARACISLGPGLGVDERALAVLGMAAWFTGSVRAPLTSIVLILEMTANQEQLFALAACCLTAHLTAELLRGRPIYDALLEQDLRRSGISTASAEPVRVVMGVQHGSLLDGKTLREAEFPPGCVVVEIERRGIEIPPAGSTRLLPGDHVTVLAPGEDPGAALRVVEMCQGK